MFDVARIQQTLSLRHWALAVLASVLATLLCLGLASLLPVPSLALFYLGAVLLTAVSTGTGPALLAAVLSFLAYNFFFTEPHYTLFILHREDLLTAALLILVAVVTGQLAARLREKVDALETSHRWNREQMEMARELSSCIQAQELVDLFASQLHRYFGLAPEPEVTPAGPAGGAAAASREGQVCLDMLEGKPRIRFMDGDGVRAGLCLPGPWPPERDPGVRLEACLELVRLAWSRVLLFESLHQETQVKEREQLRSALLSSISHDLRTPLSAMIGSVSSLIDLDASLSPAQKEELLGNTLSEACRLDRYIQKLLDMTKLGQGELKLERDWIGVEDLLSVVIRRANALLGSEQRIQVDLSGEPALLYVHAALLEQAIFNVLENAIRFSPPMGVVDIRARVTDGALQIEVQDQGPGIPEALWPQIFDMFFTFSHGDQQAGGTGLGLAICQGILGAHGGQAQVVDSSSAGTTIRLVLPLDQRLQGEGR